MRVAYISYGVLSPTRAHNLQTTRTLDALASLDVDVTFIAPKWYEPWAPAAPVVPNVPRVETVLVAKRSLYDAYRRVATGGRFWALFTERSVFALEVVAKLKKIRPDVVVTRDVVVCFWLAALRSTLGLPVVYEIHSHEQTLFAAGPRPAAAAGDVRATASRRADFALHQSDDSLGGRLYLRMLRALENWAIARADATIVLTRTFARALVRELGIRPPLVVRSGQAVAAARTTKAEYRRQLGIPLDRRVALYAGLTFGGKEPERLLEVARELPHDCMIVIVGGTPEEHAALVAKARAADVAGRVMVRGRVPQSEVAAYLHAADVGLLVYPETPCLGVHACALKLVEYLAAGLPPVASDSPAVREIVRDGENGIILGSRDAGAIAAEIAALLRDDERRARLAACAREEAQRFTFEERARTLWRSLRDVVERARRDRNVAAKEAST